MINIYVSDISDVIRFNIDGRGHNPTGFVYVYNLYKL